jgi:hypothetical protein
MKRTLITLVIATILPLSVSAQNVPGAHFLENWDQDGNGAVTLAEAEQRRSDVFLSFDANDDGALDAEEYAMFDEARANDMAGSDAGNGMKRVQEGMTLTFNDIDADGHVSQAEFLARTADWLALIDRNGDGSITAQDFGPASN